jgi:hypothetical protein
LAKNLILLKKYMKIFNQQSPNVPVVTSEEIKTEDPTTE